MRKLHLFVFAFFLICSLAQDGFGQESKSLKKYRQTPLWIAMMNDTNTNYFEAGKAFDTYWEKRPKPIEEQEIIGQDHGKRKDRETYLGGLFQSKKEKRQQESDKYVMEYKKFRNWQRLNLPYVQSDGRILGPAERLKIWKEQKQN
jgi:hypothetical protein